MRFAILLLHCTSSQDRHTPNSLSLKMKSAAIDRPTEPSRFSCSGGINNENKGSLPSKETGPQYCTPRIIVSSFFCYSFLVHHLVHSYIQAVRARFCIRHTNRSISIWRTSDKDIRPTHDVWLCGVKSKSTRRMRLRHCLSMNSEVEYLSHIFVDLLLL